MTNRTDPPPNSSLIHHYTVVVSVLCSARKELSLADKEQKPTAAGHALEDTIKRTTEFISKLVAIETTKAGNA